VRRGGRIFERSRAVELTEGKPCTVASFQIRRHFRVPGPHHHRLLTKSRG
jgi:hypothetical protein